MRLLIAMFVVFSIGAASPPGLTTRIVLIAGRNGQDPGQPPARWDEASMGAWNATEPAYNPATQRLVYQSSRSDLQAPAYALNGTCSSGGLTYFSAAPVAGAVVCQSSPASVIYVDAPNGGDARCIGCEDVVDDGTPDSAFFVYKNSWPQGFARRQQNSRVAPGTHGPYAVQSKQIPTWHPDGHWIIVSVEMPVHLGNSASAGGETGYYNDLWAVSDDGRRWVQLTDFAATWPVAFASPGSNLPNAVTFTPYRCDQSACSTGCQFVKPGFEHPYDSYWCSAAGEAPPAGGVVRPHVGNTVSPRGTTPVVWGEQVGSATRYTWQSIWQLATAEISIHSGTPLLSNYQRNLTPTPDHPDGSGLWNNPGNGTVIGAGYEPTGFAPHDDWINLATDAFFSENGGKTYSVEYYSQSYVDATLWRPGDAPRLIDMTAYDPAIYEYGPNGSPPPFNSYGYWEEMSVLSPPGRGGGEWFAFSSSDSSNPPYDAFHLEQMQLETWIVRADGQSPAMQLTHFNSTDPADAWYQQWPGSFSTGAPRAWVSPMSWDSADRGLYVMVAPNAQGYSGPPANRIYKIYIREQP